MFEPSLVITMLNITSTFYVYPLKRDGECVFGISYPTLLLQLFYVLVPLLPNSLL